MIMIESEWGANVVHQNSLRQNIVSESNRCYHVCLLYTELIISLHVQNTGAD